MLSGHTVTPGASTLKTSGLLSALGRTSLGGACAYAAPAAVTKTTNPTQLHRMGVSPATTSALDENVTAKRHKWSKRGHPPSVSRRDECSAPASADDHSLARNTIRKKGRDD